MAGLPFPYIYCSTCTTGIECSDFTTSSKMCQVFSEKMGLEAGWNCHICLRTEHSTDASATMPPAADMSHGYASMMMDSLLNINSTQPQNGRRTRVAVLTLDRIRYNTIRDAILMCAQTLTWVSLIYRMEPTTKKWEKKKKRICTEVSVNSLGNLWSQSWRRRGRLRREGFAEKEGDKRGMREWGGKRSQR